MSRSNSNIVDLNRHRQKANDAGQNAARSQIIRLAPEYDGLSLVYSCKPSARGKSDRLYSMKILCWALHADNSISAMVPWLQSLSSGEQLESAIDGEWLGYYDPGLDVAFEEVPEHKQLELESAARFFYEGPCHGSTIIQEIPDPIGTHALLGEKQDSQLTLTEVLSWRLYGSGKISAMLIDQDKVSNTPVLPGDACLYEADQEHHFRYFFQRDIANQIKEEDPVALAAISILFD